MMKAEGDPSAFFDLPKSPASTAPAESVLPKPEKARDARKIQGTKNTRKTGVMAWLDYRI